MASTRPKEITGGCLCGALRYTISFPPDSDWPPKNNATCQCTRCRKFTGALVPQLIAFPSANVTPNLSLQPTYKSYTTPAGGSAAEGGGPGAKGGGTRIFCSECGSSIAYVNETHIPGITEIQAGSLDEDVLAGKEIRREAVEIDSKDGGGVLKRDGGYGAALCGTDTHMWLENAVPGLTDQMEGNKHERGRDSRLRE